MLHYSRLFESNYQPNYRTFRRGRYFETECSDIFTFDIETTSYWLIDGELTAYKAEYKAEQLNDAPKGAIVWIWQISVNQQVYYGRDISEILEVLDYLNSRIDSEALKYIYVHNLAYETQFIREIVSIDTVFARSPRKPMYLKANGFEWRCSYMLTRLSLATWGESIGLPKMVGDLDYNVLRTPYTTNITDTELGYCQRDCEVVYRGIEKFVEKYGSISRIPLTQTGEVRRVVVQKLSKDKDHHTRMAGMIPRSYDFYKTLKWCFAGGSTGGCYLNAGKVLQGVASFDKTSDYPSQMVYETYPITQFYNITGTEEAKHIDSTKNAYIYIARLTNVRAKTPLSYLSTSRCLNIKWAEGLDRIDNGRVRNCDSLVTCINDDDLHILELCYEFDLEVLRLYQATKGRLNIKLIEYVLELYHNKTTLKGIEGQDELYAQSKQFINSMFGMMVMDDMQAECEWVNDDWVQRQLTEQDYYINIEEKLNEKWRCNFSYAQGLYITSRARRELWEVLIHIANESEEGCDIVYYDTDSCKFLNYEKYKPYFEQLNEELRQKAINTAEELGIDYQLFAPKDSKGNTQLLGHWDFEGIYTKGFIFQGAKRYAYEIDDGIHMTVSGVPKPCAIALNSLEEFKDGYEFDKDITDSNGNYLGKKLSQYLDGDNLQVTFPDGYKVYTTYSTVMRNNGYKLGLSSDYKLLIANGREKGRI